MCAKEPTQESCEKGLKSDPIDTWSMWTRRKGTPAQEKNAGADRLPVRVSIWEEYEQEPERHAGTTGSVVSRYQYIESYPDERQSNTSGKIK